jgi:hypothetical protein
MEAPDYIDYTIHICNYGGPATLRGLGGGWVGGSQRSFDFLLMVSETFCTAPPPLVQIAKRKASRRQLLSVAVVLG